MKCWRCNQEIEMFSNFCRHCGAGQGNVKYNDTFVDTPQQMLFAQIFRFDMPLDKKLSKQYRRPIPDMKTFERNFNAIYGDDYCEPTFKDRIAVMYGEPVAQWLDDLMPNIICYERTMDLRDIWHECRRQSDELLK